MARLTDSGEHPDPPPVVSPSLDAPDGTPLYVHVPYCVVKCSYCDFFSVVADGADLPGTVDAILAEAERRAPRAPRTVFVGGGTPSLLPEPELARLFDGLDRLTGFRDSSRETTVECNPESLDAAKAQALVGLGVDRLSIGFQSLDPRILELFGRVHSTDESFAAFEAARAAGPRAVNVDLIYGVPGEELTEWLAHLERVLALGPDHVSAYTLAWEPGTQLTKDLETGRLERLDEETELAFFLQTRGVLEDHGFAAYEVSNFATPGHQCLHNVHYWNNGAYVGIGPGAVSRLADTRFGNPRSVGAWRAALGRGDFPASWEERLAPIARLAETWWLGLRTSRGVNPREALSASGVVESSAGEPFERLVDELAGHGLVERHEGRVRLTPRGLPLADAVSTRFLELTPPTRSAAGAAGTASGMGESPASGDTMSDSRA